MEKADKVTIRLAGDQAAALDFMIEEGRFRNRSDAIRAAVDRITGESEEERGKITVNLPDSLIAIIDKLVDLEHFRSRDHGIFEFIRNGIENLDLDMMMLRKRQIDEILAEKKASDIMGDVYSDYVKQ